MYGIMAMLSKNTLNKGGILMRNEIVLFENQNVKLEVSVQDETVWLTLEQMAKLFDRDRTVITRHINNIFKEGELDKKEVSAKFAHTTRHGALSDQTQTRDLDYYNLDIIISVGYRVKSKNGILFRKWANQVLKEYLIKGYAINKKRLDYLEKTVKLIDIAGRIENNDTKEVLNVINKYTKALELLDDYDHKSITRPNGFTTKKILTYEECKNIIETLRFNEQSDLFALERNQGLKTILGAIYQTFDNKDVYPTFEEKAANFLYLIIKNHTFIDGNKRIGATLFIYFLQYHGRLYQNDKQIIDNNTLVAITLLIAQSNPNEKNVMIDLIMNFLELPKPKIKSIYKENPSSVLNWSFLYYLNFKVNNKYGDIMKKIFIIILILITSGCSYDFQMEDNITEIKYEQISINEKSFEKIKQLINDSEFNQKTPNENFNKKLTVKTKSNMYNFKLSENYIEYNGYFAKSDLKNYIEKEIKKYNDFNFNIYHTNNYQISESDKKILIDNTNNYIIIDTKEKLNDFKINLEEFNGHDYDDVDLLYNTNQTSENKIVIRKNLEKSIIRISFKNSYNYPMSIIVKKENNQIIFDKKSIWDKIIYFYFVIDTAISDNSETLPHLSTALYLRTKLPLSSYVFILEVSSVTNPSDFILYQ